MRAFDVKNTAKGPVFTFEVTVVRPSVTNDSGSLSFDNVEFNTNSLIKRHFVLVPAKVTWASEFDFPSKSRINKLSGFYYYYFIQFAGVLIKHLDDDVDAHFCIHSVQLLPQRSCKSMEYYKMFNMRSNEFQANFAVEVRFP